VASFLHNKTKRMKKITSIIIACIIALTAFAQNNVGIGTASPAASAALDITSTTKGLLIPRMTSAERTAIVSPAKGLMVFDNNSSTYWFYNGSAWTEMTGGSSGGNFSLPYSGFVASASPALNISNTGDGKAITASSASSFTAAIEGTGNGTGGYGVVGNSQSNSGYGIYGLNPTGTAVYGFSASGGVALRGNSPTGYALLTNGNLRLTGGNTNPVEGAVLTSVDANGNAVWKPRKVAFAASHLPTGANVANATTTTMFLANEEFDSGNDFNTQSAATDPSTFIAPVAGVYQFYSEVQIYLSSSVYNLVFGIMYMQKNGNEIASASSYFPDNTSNASSMSLSLNRTVRLNAGDKVKVVLRQTNNGSITAQQYQSYFTGHLVYAD
jgi:hypothetical protein